VTELELELEDVDTVRIRRPESRTSARGGGGMRDMRRGGWLGGSKGCLVMGVGTLTGHDVGGGD
jgi:hypothetical protein